MNQTLIADRLARKRKSFIVYQWEFSYGSLYGKTASYEDLRKHISSEDVNTRIFAIKHISPLILDLLTPEERADLAVLLKARLTDESQCQRDTEGDYRDESDDTTVADAARETLSKLEKDLEEK